MKLELEAAALVRTMKMDQKISQDDSARQEFLTKTRELRSEMSKARGDALMAFGGFLVLNEVAVDSRGVHFTFNKRQYTIGTGEDVYMCIAISEAIVRLQANGVKADFIERYRDLRLPGSEGSIPSSQESKSSQVS